jgi:hypothetical protein
MSIIISSNPTKNNIRVGYIDPKLGYVDNVSIRQANKYARNNPGTSFIFTDGDNNVNYLNINQVNELTGQELLPTKPCEGIVDRPVQPPTIQFSGGGGIGALANAVIGEDGSILAVDIESGGNGYQYPPTVYANDFSGSGSGAVFRVTLGDDTAGPLTGPAGPLTGPAGPLTGPLTGPAGPLTGPGGPLTGPAGPLTGPAGPLTGPAGPGARDFETVLDCSALNEISEDYIDFEDDVVDFGRVYDQTGKDLGPWEPRSYLNVSSNAVQEFIDTLNAPPTPQEGLCPPNPFWSTRFSNSSERWYPARYSSWSKFTNRHAISPVPPSNSSTDTAGIVFRNSWTIDAPYSGVYGFRGTADHIGKFFVDGREIVRLQSFRTERPETVRFNLSKGRHTVSIELESNPSTQRVNLIGISAVIIACCPKRAGGRGVVIEVIPEEPGNNYLPPRVTGDSIYPVSLVLDDVIIENPGINYNCEVDQIVITPSNGAELDYVCDDFGRITNVNVLNPGFGFTTYPTIRISTASGGVNAKFIPKLKVIRDPIVVNESKLIQVTDLVGIKQTGYIDGRPYFGAVFYENNIKYAGYYETVGDLVQVYDTLKESIDAQVTTSPSAIQRQGTDVTFNDPRLNIPGTPQNLI